MPPFTSRATKSLSVYVTLACETGGRTFRLPGPLALVQTDVGATAQYEITHVNGLSLPDIAATCPEVSSPSDAAQLYQEGLLTSVSRGAVSVSALTVVAVHAALLGDGTATSAAPGHTQPGNSPSHQQCSDPESAQRALMRAGARLVWGLAGLVFELMHAQAGHWPALRDQVCRQAIAGAVLTQLYRLDGNLALAVLRAYGQLNPARFGEMLQSGLLPPPARAAPAAAGAGPGCPTATPPEGACAGGPAIAGSNPSRAAEDAAARV